MENPANYSSLIQLAVTFNFVFVVFRHESEDKAKMLIDTFIEKWRKIFQEETNALFTAIQEMVYNKFSILKEKPVISKYHEELKKNYRSFQELISWWFFVKFGGNLFFISMVFLFFFLNPIKSCRYVCFLVTLKTPHH